MKVEASNGLADWTATSTFRPERPTLSQGGPTVRIRFPPAASQHEYYSRRLGVHLSWIGDLGGYWDEITFHETHDTGFLLARLDQLWRRVPRTKPLSVGVVLLDLVPAARHQPDLFAADNHRRQQLSPLVDRINDRYGRCTIGFGLFPPDVRAFKGHAAFHRVPERWEF